MKIQGKTFVVTGAGGGIGAALVKELIHRGGKVAAIDLDESRLSTLEQSVNNRDHLATFSVNITNRADVEKLPEAINEKLGAVDSLINNAGIIQPFVKVIDLEYEVIERVMNVNFYGTLTMTKTFLPHLLERDEAHLVSVSSMGGFLPVPGQSIYGASKAAVKLLNEGLFAELQDTSVRVSTVFPGATETAITKNSNVDTPQISGKTPDMLSPQEAANIIINGIEKNKPLIYTGKDSFAMQLLYRMSPVRATKLIASKMKSLLD